MALRSHSCCALTSNSGTDVAGNARRGGKFPAAERRVARIELVPAAGSSPDTGIRLPAKKTVLFIGNDSSASRLTFRNETTNSKKGGKENFGYIRWLSFLIPVSVTGVRPVPKHRRVLGENIRTHRKRAGLSQEKLAEKAELSPTYISDVERGEENISVDALVRIAKAFNTSLSDLIRGL